MSRADGDRLEKQEKMQVQSDAMIDLLTDRGILPDTGIDNEKVREARKEKQKIRCWSRLIWRCHGAIGSWKAGWRESRSQGCF